jgi:nitroreductase
MPASTEKTSKIVANEALLEQLRWRYATKKFDATKKISPEDWATLEEALLLAPSSFGLQPWKFFVIRDPALRAKLKAASWNQSQVTDASHYVVFAIRKGLNEEDVQKLIDRVSDVRNIPTQNLEEYKKIMLGSISVRTPEQLDAWCARQVYIALGIFLASAAVLGIDACPMEGFEPKKFDEILGLEKLGYTAVVMATAGYRSKEDHYGELAKVRFEAKDVIVGI